MQQSVKGQSPSVRVPWRKVALPTEHDRWRFTLEPLLLGLLIVPTVPAIILAVVALAFFLIRQPVKVLVSHWPHSRYPGRAFWAWRFVSLYTALMLVGMLLLAQMAGAEWLIPPLLALPVGLMFIYYDFTQPGRSWQTDITAAIAFTSVAASIGLLAGWALAPSLALWIVLMARTIPSALYVHTRLRLDLGSPVERWIPVLAHGIGLLVTVTLSLVSLLPHTAIIPLMVLLIRSLHGLSRWRWQASVKAVYLSELTIGAFFVLLVAIGY